MINRINKIKDGKRGINLGSCWRIKIVIGGKLGASANPTGGGKLGWCFTK